MFDAAAEAQEKGYRRGVAQAILALARLAEDNEVSLSKEGLRYLADRAYELRYAGKVDGDYLTVLIDRGPLKAEDIP